MNLNCEECGSHNTTVIYNYAMNLKTKVCHVCGLKRCEPITVPTRAVKAPDLNAGLVAT